MKFTKMENLLMKMLIQCCLDGFKEFDKIVLFINELIGNERGENLIHVSVVLVRQKNGESKFYYWLSSLADAFLEWEIENIQEGD